MTQIDRTGHAYGNWTVLEQAPRRAKKIRWRCRCVCGAVKDVDSYSLSSGASASCGCRGNDSAKKHPLYRTWLTMRERCNRPNNENYKYYGGRGIGVCDRWSDFWSFVADMGPRPSPQHTLDRIDTDLDYTPENCRWATPREQAANRRNTIYVYLNDNPLPLAETVRRIGTRPYGTALRLFHEGKPLSDVFGVSEAVSLRRMAP